MIRVKTKQEIAILKEGGGVLAAILHSVAERVAPGVRTGALNAYAEELLRAQGASGSFKGYRTNSSRMPYPAALCTSVNDEIVHGIPGDRILREGDIVTLDIGVEHKGHYTDAAVTVPVGVVSKKSNKLIATAKEALARGISAARAGNHLGDIGNAIESCVTGHGLEIVRGLVGHGVGFAVHEAPDVPNVGEKGAGPELVEGMVLAIEPMVTTGAGGIVCDETGWVWRTRDGAPAAHFEHTVAVQLGDALVLTL